MLTRRIAELLEGEIVGDDAIEITGLSKIEAAEQGSITFLSNPKYEKYLEQTGASAVIVSASIDLTKFSKLPPAVIKTPDPYVSFVFLLETFYPQAPQVDKGIHPTAVIASTARLGADCAVGAHVCIGEKSVIGNRTVIHPNTVIGNSVTVGDDCLIYANVSIREECIIGNRVVFQPGVVIGSDGFGFAPKKDGSYRKIPQRGIVVIEDDVEIQANSTIDRATMGETRIKRGTKLDNLVQIAHNVVIGEDTVFAAQSGVAGSSKVGNRVMVGGNVGIAGHLVIADRVGVMGQSGVSKSLVKEGEIFFGTPAKEVHKARRIEAASRQLPELIPLVYELQKKVAVLEEERRKLKND